MFEYGIALLQRLNIFNPGGRNPVESKQDLACFSAISNTESPNATTSEGARETQKAGWPIQIQSSEGEKHLKGQLLLLLLSVLNANTNSFVFSVKQLGMLAI